jgi:hypothetical protein
MKGTPLESFFVALGFEIDTKELDNFEKTLDGAKQSVMSMTAVAGAAAAAIGVFVYSIAQSVDELGDFAEQEQVSAQAIQEFGHAAQLNGSSVDALKSTIQGLNRVTGEAINGLGRGQKAFETFGLQAKDSQGNVKTFDTLLLEVADKMQGMSRQAAISMAEKLGIDRSLIPLLMKGRDAIQELRLEAQAFGVTTDEELVAAGEFTDAFDQMRFVMTGLARGIATSLMPQMTQVIVATRKWLVENREVIKNSIAGALRIVNMVLGTLWDYIYRVLSLLKPFVEWLKESNVALYAFAAIAGVILKLATYKAVQSLASAFAFLAKMITVTNVAALATTIILGLLIAGVALLIDDFINWREGNESFIGDMIKQFPWLLDFINTLEGAVSSFVGFWMQQWNELQGPLTEMGTALWELIRVVGGALWSVISTVFSGWAMLMQYLLPVIIPVVTWIAKFLVGAITLLIDTLGVLFSVASSVFNGIATSIQFIVDLFRSGVEVVQGFLSAVAGGLDFAKRLLGMDSSVNINAIGAAPSNASQFQGGVGIAGAGGILGNTQNSNTTNTTQTNITVPKIEIKSTDPAKAGESVRQELERMNKTAIRNGQSAVAL